MAQDVDQIVVGGAGDLYVAPVGTAAPADSQAAWGAGWVNLGLVSDDGVTLSDSKTVEDIPAWQLFYPARRIVTERSFQASFTLLQWSKATVELAFGATVTEPAAGEFRIAPPSAASIGEQALGIEWEDGAETFRLIIPRGIVTDSVEANVVRTDAAGLPVTFGVVGESGVDPWYILTNSTAFESA